MVPLIPTVEPKRSTQALIGLGTPAIGLPPNKDDLSPWSHPPMSMAVNITRSHDTTGTPRLNASTRRGGHGTCFGLDPPPPKSGLSSR